MGNKIRFALGGMVVAASFSVFAADNGFYIGADVGSAKLNSSGTLTKSTDTVGGVFGGYQLNKNWGAELQYTGLGGYSGVGRTTGSNYTSKNDAWSLSATGTWPFMQDFSAYAKLGVASTNNKQSSSVNGNTNTSRTDASYGLGVGYALNPKVGFRFGWDRFRTDSYVASTKVTNTNNLDIWSLGLTYKF